MSAAASAPISTTLPAHAFSLFCRGLRSPDISRQLGVPERTIRAWIASVRQDIAASEHDRLAEELFRAVEHLHQLSAAAWAAFERDQNQPAPSLASPTSAPGTLPETPYFSSTPTPSATPRTRAASHGPRYLRLAFDAQRQINNLLSLYGIGDPSALISTAPPTPAPPTPAPPTPAPPTPAPPSAATPAPVTPLTRSPRKTAIPAELATQQLDAAPAAPAKIEIPAKSATASASALAVVGALPAAPAGYAVPLSGKTAIAPARQIAISAESAMPLPSSPSSFVPLRVLRDLRGSILISASAPKRQRPSRKSRRACK